MQLRGIFVPFGSYRLIDFLIALNSGHLEDNEAGGVFHGFPFEAKWPPAKNT